MKTNKTIHLIILGLLAGCAQAPRSPKLVEYQTKSSKTLGAYARAVSSGFRGVSSSSSTRGLFDFANPDQQSLYNTWNQQNGNYVMKQQIQQEVQDCKTQVEAIPKNCANLGFMISSLARCLDRVISYQNPIYSHGYRQMDQPSRRNWTYLLDWRRPKPVQYFSPEDYQLMHPYAYSGWIPENVTE